MPLTISARCAVLTLAALIGVSVANLSVAQVVPGTGVKLGNGFDDFEDESWGWIHNLPKGSYEEDKQSRYPAGTSKNRKWYESALRGQPDMIKRVPTPEGGLSGSKASLLMRSCWTGVPKYPSREPKQDDLLFNSGGEISVSRSPSFVVRVWMPPFEKWEQRTGNSFGIRAGARAPSNKRGKDIEPYWPGMFIHFNRGDGKDRAPYATILIRGNERGHDFRGPKISEPGWWTFGMSFTPDGAVHYYAHAGIEKLTAADRLTSQYPYGFRAQSFSTFFFNVIAADDGRTWSTPWIVDDPAIYVLRR